MEQLKGILSDLDGTIYFKGKLLYKSNKAIETLRHNGISIKFLTNTSTLTNIQISNRLKKLGLNIKPKDLFTPITATQHYFDNNPKASYFVAANKTIQDLFKPGNWDSRNPDYVILGDFQKICTYDLLNTIFRYLDNGASLITTSLSPYFYNDRGINLDTGSFAKLFEYSKNIKSMVIGKPSELFFKLAYKSLSIPKRQIAVIGDDLRSDILGANRVGLTSILVKTGKFDATVKAKSKPDYIINNFSSLLKLIKL